MRTPLPLYSLLILMCLLITSLPAQEKPKDKPRDIEFSADTVDYDDAKKRIRLVGNVIIESEGSTLKAPYAVYYTDKEYAEFLGGVKMVGEQSTATGKEMRVWYRESRGRLEGDVRLITQQGTDGKENEPAIVLCEVLDYNWLKEEGVATGRVKMRQGIKRAFADRAEIYQKRNEMLLIGNVRVEQGDGDWLTAERAIYDTEKQTVRAEGRVVAKTRLDQQSEKEDGSESSAPVKATLPEPLLAEPKYELLPLRRFPTIPLPWLDR